MSHSQWEKKKYKKAASEGKISKLYSKLVRNIMSEVKKSGGNRDADSVRAAITKARSYDMPNENIERAIARASEPSAALESITYEAYGPGGVGITGIRLEVDSQIILGSSSQIKNLTKAVYRTGLNIDDLVLSILATAEAVITPRQKDIGVVVVNIGVSTTSLVVFEAGDILHTAILPIGSEHITNDIAIGLRTSIEVAEAVKVEYGDCAPAEVSKREEIDLYDLGAAGHEMVKKQYVSEIIEARVEEILQKIDAELMKIKRNGLLPAGAIFTGGGSKLPGLIETAKKVLRLPAVLGYPLHVTSVTDKVNDLAFSTAVGLVKWGNTMQGYGYTARPDRGGSMKKMGRMSSQLKKWIKTLIP
jgi:cell division protein FtsA